MKKLILGFGRSKSLFWHPKAEYCFKEAHLYSTKALKCNKNKNMWIMGGSAPKVSKQNFDPLSTTHNGTCKISPYYGFSNKTAFETKTLRKKLLCACLSFEKEPPSRSETGWEIFSRGCAKLFCLNLNIYQCPTARPPWGRPAKSEGDNA